MPAGISQSSLFPGSLELADNHRPYDCSWHLRWSEGQPAIGMLQLERFSTRRGMRVFVPGDSFESRWGEYEV